MRLLAVATTLALLQTSPSPDRLVEDVRALTLAQDHEQRFEALATLLRARQIPFEVEPVPAGTPGGAASPTSGRNVVVTIGTAPEDIVIGAHYDAARLPGGSLSRGAVDNAGSSVALVQLADTLRDERLPLRVRIVWFDLEESGLLGSRRYLADHSADRIRAMLNFDINAYGDTVLFASPKGGESAALRTAMLEACAAESLDCVRFEQMPTSDDRSFGAAGIPTLSIAQLPAIEVHQLWLLMHARKTSGLAPGTTPSVLQTIHTAGDVIGKVEGTAIARAHRLAAALVRRLAR